MAHAGFSKAENSKNIAKVLNDGTYNNVSLLCRDGVEVTSNALFLASISPWMCKLLKEQEEQDHFFFCLPDIDSSKISNLFDNLCKNFTSKSVIESFVDLDILTFLMPQLSSTNKVHRKVLSLPHFKITPLTQTATHLVEKFEEKEECLDTEDTDDLLPILCESNLSVTGVKSEDEIDLSNLENLESELFSNEQGSDIHKNLYKKLIEKCKLIAPKPTPTQLTEICDSNLISNDLVEDGLENFLKTIDVTCEDSKAKSNGTLRVKSSNKGLKYKKRKGNPHCEECGKSLKSWRSLEMHIKAVHSKTLERNYPCDFCSYSAKTLSTLKNHEKYRHLETDKYQCDQCEYKAPSKHNMLRHIKTHLTKKEFQCGICKKLSISQEGLKRHMKRNHNIPCDEDSEMKFIKPLIKLCPDCGKEFGNVSLKDRAKFNSHMLTHRLERFSCECEVTWKSNYEKERHMKIVHMGFSECPHCHDAFKNDLSVQKHIEHFHSESNENLVCHICGIPVRNIQMRQVHMRREHDTNILKCPECGKEFQGKFRLDRHIGDVHKPPKQCADCGEYFNNLRKHRRNVHMDDKDKNYQCQICGKGFVYRRKLEFHKMSVHIKARPYVCRYGSSLTGQGCNMSYNDESNRNAHEKKKHGGLFTKIVTNLIPVQ